MYRQPVRFRDAVEIHGPADLAFEFLRQVGSLPLRALVCQLIAQLLFHFGERLRRRRFFVDELGGLDYAITIAKQRAKIPVESDVELVVYPPRKSFYEIVSDELSGSRESRAVGAWLNANVSKGELEILSAVRGPLGMFRRGEPLALMPFTFLR